MRFLFVVYDNDSYIHYFPQGPAYIASVLLGMGHEVHFYNQDIHHWPDEHLTQYLDNHFYDVVGVGVIAGYYQYQRLLKISEAINRSKQRPFYILGGHGPAPEPKYFLEKTGADLVVHGEAEETIVELMNALENKTSLGQVAGLSYLDGGRLVRTPPRGLIQDLDTLPIPAYQLLPMEVYRLMRMPHIARSDFSMPLLTGRGCTFTCNFCYRMDKGLRTRSLEPIIEEIKLLKRDYGINYIIFSDELLMASTARTAEISEAIIKHDLNIKWWCQGRLNYAEPELLQLMKRSGCVFINYGIEAMDDEVLKRMDKGLRVEQVERGIIHTLEAGISPGFNIIFGHLGDSREVLEKGVEFLLKYDDGAQLRTIRPVTPYPGSPLYDRAIADGKLKDCAEFYEKRHVNSDLLSVNMTDMSDDDFYAALESANTRLVENYFKTRMKNELEKARAVYRNRDATFRGFRQS